MRQLVDHKMNRSPLASVVCLIDKRFNANSVQSCPRYPSHPRVTEDYMVKKISPEGLRIATVFHYSNNFAEGSLNAQLHFLTG